VRQSSALRAFVSEAKLWTGSDMNNTVVPDFLHGRQRSFGVMRAPMWCKT
jgi:hypothetical protein